ncbi:MAG: D-Ala-D-Ala carboxypeptidase family metallohydrolase [Akkermansiaceae bacterium]
MSATETGSRVITPTRRDFLAATAGAATGFVAMTQTSHGYLFRQSPPLDISSLPKSWVLQQGEKQIQGYAKYLEGLRLKYVSPIQVIEAHAKAKGRLWNSLPPRSMWRSMGGTLKVADRVAATIGQTVKEVTSAYRSPSYNRRCPGANPRSWHMQNFALDLKFKASSSTVARAARAVRSEGFFKGGIGRYSAFTHIDTRGQNVDW